MSDWNKGTVGARVFSPVKNAPERIDVPCRLDPQGRLAIHRAFADNSRLERIKYCNRWRITHAATGLALITMPTGDPIDHAKLVAELLIAGADEAGCGAEAWSDNVDEVKRLLKPVWASVKSLVVN